VTVDPGSRATIAEVRGWARIRAGTDTLTGHLEGRHGIRVTQITELDVGVLRVDRHDGPSWVARIFPAARPLDEVEGDARVLRGLERRGFPAERCAVADPVSTHEGQGVLVTELVEGTRARGGGRSFAVLGELLGRLHAASAATVAGLREGGAWHHLCLRGGPADELAAALVLLDEHAAGVDPHEAPLLRRLREAVEGADACQGLPEAILHPDFVPANALVGPDQHLVLIDWTGAGRGPRLWSLAFLLWAAGTWDLRFVDAVVSHYARHVQLQPEELSRLEAAVRARPLVLEAWSVCLHRKPLEEVARELTEKLDVAAATAARAVQGFEGAVAS
jgi:Ser/Thr protein kinase RdoA (MazF antagonist)